MATRTAKQPTVRLLKKAEHIAASRLVAGTMLASLQDELVDSWGATFTTGPAHLAFSRTGELAGVARWFPTDLSLDGGSIPAAAVTAVAVATNHRRQGHLTRLMHEQLASVVKKKVPMALLVAAEWPIYGRFGYGPAIDACGIELDSTVATFLAARTGSIDLVTQADLRPHLEAMHNLRWARTMGAITRDDWFWDRAAGVEPWPGDAADPGKNRAALWRDDQGKVQGAVSYVVQEGWTNNRPSGVLNARLLLGATPEAERELWRHLTEVDWATSVQAGNRSVEDPVLLMLANGRAALRKDQFDCIWARVLDVPKVFAARRAPLAGQVVVKVTDDLGYASGTWSLEIGPDSAEVTPTKSRAEVRIPVGPLSAASLGGRSVAQMHQAGLLDEVRPGGIDRLDALLRSPVAPWSPTTY